MAKGDRLIIRTGDDVGGPGEVFTTYAPLAASVVAGQQLLLDDGRIVLRVDATDGVAVQTTVVHGSPLGEHKGITAPGVALPSEGLTPKDDADLRFGIAAGVDMVALSFVQHVADVRAARAVVLEALGTPATPIVAKLERPQAIDHLDAILAEADAVMVARGDLGLEVPLERVPRLQKEITRRARAAGPAGDCRHAGARVHAQGAAAHARRGERRRQCGRRRRGRDHAGGRDGVGRVSRWSRCGRWTRSSARPSSCRRWP